MQIRRSQLEADKREQDRKDLAQKVGDVFKHDPFAARILEPTAEEKKVTAEAEDKKIEPVKAPSAQEHNLSRQAIHFASNTFKDLGLHNISLAPGAVTPSDSVSGPKINLIRSASVKLKGSVKKAQNQQIVDKPFEVNMSFENGKFSVDSLEKNDQLFPINKGSLEKVTAMEEEEDDEGDENKKEASVPDKQNQKKPGIPTGKSTPLCPKCGSKLSSTGKCPDCNYHADM